MEQITGAKLILSHLALIMSKVLSILLAMVKSKLLNALTHVMPIQLMMFLTAKIFTRVQEPMVFLRILLRLCRKFTKMVQLKSP